MTNNNSRSAWAYLHSNYEKLHEEARKELSKSGSDSKTIPGSAHLLSSSLHPRCPLVFCATPLVAFPLAPFHAHSAVLV